MSDDTKEKKEIVRAVDDAIAYPVLTQEVTSGGGVQNLSVDPQRSPDTTVQNTLRQILGRRPGSGGPLSPVDVKGISAALAKTFKLKTVEGHIEWDVTPQSFSVQADLGELTGAQASIYARAQAALDDSLPLLDNLTPLLPDPDTEDIETMRSIVRSELIQLVAELGLPGGPRVQRVDSLFTLLTGSAPDYANPMSVRGQFGDLKSRFGMLDKYINTVEDEQDLTNFMILVEYVFSLRQTWEAQRSSFANGNNPFLGNQLILISQLLDSILDSIQSLCDALASVYIGAPERQTIFLRFYDEAELTLDDLFNWVTDHATNSKTVLLSSKDGLVAFRTTMNLLEYLMVLTLKLADSGKGGYPAGLYSVRSRRALQEVLSFLRLAFEEADKIRREAFDDPKYAYLASLAPKLRAVESLPSPLPAIHPARPTDPSHNPWPGIQLDGKNFEETSTVKLIALEDPRCGCYGSLSLENASRPSGHRLSGHHTAYAFFDPKSLKIFEFFGQESRVLVVVTNSNGERAWREARLSFTFTAGVATINVLPPAPTGSGLGVTSTPPALSAGGPTVVTSAALKAPVGVTAAPASAAASGSPAAVAPSIQLFPNPLTTGQRHGELYILGDNFRTTRHGYSVEITSSSGDSHIKSGSEVDVLSGRIIKVNVEGFPWAKGTYAVTLIISSSTQLTAQLSVQ